MALLEDRAAVITGAARGIGFEIARVFVAEGARVVLGDLDHGGLVAAAARLGKDESVATVTCDVRIEEQMRGLVATCVDRYGRIDVMVNNAGIVKDATLRKMSLEDFRAVVEVNLVGTWLGTREASVVMREQHAGSIVNLSSISGKVGFVGQTNYSAAKAGIVGLTKAAAKELGHLGIRVNAIQPGLIRTPMTEELRADIFEQKVREVPMGRAGEPSEVASVALFLASDLASYVTGAVIEVTGGRYL